jgi:ribosomal protein S27E
MGLQTTCDRCGSTVLGITGKLYKVDGKYVCAECKANPGRVAEHYCTACHAYFARPAMRGNGWIELILYFCYFIPGVIYSVWRRGGNAKTCPNCKSNAVVSASSGSHVKCPECAELVQREARKCRHCGCALVPQE